MNDTAAERMDFDDFATKLMLIKGQSRKILIPINRHIIFFYT